MMQLLKIFFKTDEDAKVIDLILTHQIVNLFLNNELRLSIHNFLIVGEILIMIHV